MARRIRLAAGTYPIGRTSLHHHVSIEGAGAEEVVIEGTLRKLRTGSILASVTVVGSVLVLYGEGPDIQNCTIRGSPESGLSCHGPVRVENCLILQNRESGIECWNGMASITDCTIMQNNIGVQCNGGWPLLARCRIQGNAYAGVFIGSLGSPTLQDSMIVGNGNTGVHCIQGTCAVTNCVIAGNAGAGGVVDQRGRATWLNSTIVQNAGGGVLTTRDGSATVRNCIVWDNGEGPFSPVTETSMTEVSYSCVQGELWPGTGNVSLDPRYARGGTFDNDRFVTVRIGGVEEQRPDFVVDGGDYHLLLASPCVDAGDPTDVAEFDIEGNSRRCWEGVDMGAYEYCGDSPPEPPARFMRGDTNTEAQLDIADAVAILARLFGGAPPLQCRDAADANDDGAVNVADGVYILQYIFVNGPAIPPPHTECGIDRTADDLGCDRYDLCVGR